jgi:hypothetical protein
MRVSQIVLPGQRINSNLKVVVVEDGICVTPTPTQGCRQQTKCSPPNRADFERDTLWRQGRFAEKDDRFEIGKDRGLHTYSDPDLTQSRIPKQWQPDFD